ncbi:branched-chain amino acid ABC transporter substrate-binding protein [Microtetraspora fusca]|uniref:branched-chain amino acid ABC transporter substrate-binding protein n=1 Tax=Microtetraspora fusca TaxID=1997 RepID=UPI00082A2C5E|nr:branched-chain amino acid ABC transporter substrate-binding protein [Microtetraspora fusca]
MQLPTNLDRRGRTRHIRWLVPLALTVLTLPAAGGCSSGGATPAAPRGDIAFGVIAPLSGPESARGQDLVDGAQMAANDLNVRGGVIGLHVSLVTVDDECLDDSGKEAAKRLHLTESVAGAIGGVCDDAAEAAARVLGGNGVPFLITSANSPTSVSAEDTPTAYLTNGTPYQEALATVHWMAYNTAQRLAVIADDTPQSAYLVKQVISVASPVPKVVSKQTLTAGRQDIAAAAATALAADPDVVYWAGSAQESGRLAAALRKAGYKGMYIASAQSESPDFLSAAGTDGAEGAYVIATASPQNLPAAEAWTKRFTKAFGRAPGRDALQAYDALRALGQAVTQTGKVDRALNSEQLTKLEDTFTTFMGALRFAPDHTVKYDNHLVLTVKSGAFTLANMLRPDNDI